MEEGLKARDRNLGERLRELRIKKKLTQQQVADFLGITKATISKYEHGERKLNDKYIEKLAQLYNVEPSYIVFGIKQDNSQKQKEIASLIASFENEIEGIGKKGTNNFTTLEHIDDFTDAWDELQKPGTITQKYTEYVLKYSYIFNILNEMGIQIKLINWHKVNICYDYQDIDVRIYELLDDIKMLDSIFRDKIKNLLKDNYGFEFEDDEQREDDENDEDDYEFEIDNDEEEPDEEDGNSSPSPDKE